MCPVANQTLSPALVKARRTTVAMKLLMAVTGALFVFYVLMHMYGNLKVFGGQAAFDYVRPPPADARRADPAVQGFPLGRSGWC